METGGVKVPMPLGGIYRSLSGALSLLSVIYKMFKNLFFAVKCFAQRASDLAARLLVQEIRMDLEKPSIVFLWSYSYRFVYSNLPLYSLGHALNSN